LHGIFCNPLADFGRIGISSSAAVGAVAAVVLDGAIVGIWTLPIFAFAAGLMVTIVVFLTARQEG